MIVTQPLDIAENPDFHFNDMTFACFQDLIDFLQKENKFQVSSFGDGDAQNRVFDTEYRNAQHVDHVMLHSPFQKSIRKSNAIFAD